MVGRLRHWFLPSNISAFRVDISGSDLMIAIQRMRKKVSLALGSRSFAFDDVVGLPRRPVRAHRSPGADSIYPYYTANVSPNGHGEWRAGATVERLRDLNFQSTRSVIGAKFPINRCV